MIIRSETLQDYPAIAAIHATAFAQRAIEAMIVSLHRHRSTFAPELSLVAELNGQVVGHVLFSPRVVRLLGENVPAVSLAPIAIAPAFQGRGIGSQLIHEGHECAAAKGYGLSFLLGHSTYYPRFGYRTRAYGNATLVVSQVDERSASLVERPPLSSDLPALREIWLAEEGAVDFAIEPGPALLDWLSPTAAVENRVFLLDDEVVGYVRYRTSTPARPLVFLARNAGAAQAIVSRLAHQAQGAELMLPLHPASASAQSLGVAECHGWEAAMAHSLRPNPFDEYYAQTQAGERPVGRVIWPVAFEL